MGIVRICSFNTSPNSESTLNKTNFVVISRLIPNTISLCLVRILFRDRSGRDCGILISGFGVRFFLQKCQSYFQRIGFFLTVYAKEFWHHLSAAVPLPIAQCRFACLFLFSYKRF